jgi:hypothetical protein
VFSAPLLPLLLQVQGQLAEVSAAFLSKVQPKGAGALSFGLCKGKLVLLGAQMGEANSVENSICCNTVDLILPNVATQRTKKALTSCGCALL